MLASQIEVGKLYVIRHHDGKFYVVRADYIKNYNTYSGYGSTGRVSRSMKHYVCTKLATGRQIEVKSAAKFRREVTPENAVL